MASSNAFESASQNNDGSFEILEVDAVFSHVLFGFVDDIGDSLLELVNMVVQKLIGLELRA